MFDFTSIGKFLIIFGIIIVAIGALLLLSKYIPWLGKLPGDIHIKKGNFSFYFPIVTCIIISIILTLIFTLIRFFRR
ncbi:DUF2905 domain-containing protein [Candidatus Poribacteria bacterium]|nr:DUF2905 domain-containing protein [Candidatus Poribacteria bacterium]